MVIKIKQRRLLWRTNKITYIGYKYIIIELQKLHQTIPVSLTYSFKICFMIHVAQCGDTQTFFPKYTITVVAHEHLYLLPINNNNYHCAPNKAAEL